MREVTKCQIELICKIRVEPALVDFHSNFLDFNVAFKNFGKRRIWDMLLASVERKRPSLSYCIYLSTKASDEKIKSEQITKKEKT